MNEPLLLLMLLVIIVLPAVLIARTGRRLGQGTRLRQQLGMWAEIRGWRLLGPDEQPIGRWQVWPFTAAEREVGEAIAGVHRGRAATSCRLDVTDGPRLGTFHVLTVALDRPGRPRTLLIDGAVVESNDAGDVTGVRAERLTAVVARHPAMSVRRERDVVVGWLPGPPLLGELDAYLDALADIA
ncbi:hypothetical protein [Georgenia sp. MJ170]|uniref:hypothetical protein n=1 Tax=Georgenia sunbinii TaxID=3117728 RepID=UPI002F2600C2